MVSMIDQLRGEVEQAAIEAEKRVQEGQAHAAEMIRLRNQQTTLDNAQLDNATRELEVLRAESAEQKRHAVMTRNSLLARLEAATRNHEEFIRTAELEKRQLRGMIQSLQAELAHKDVDTIEQNAMRPKASLDRHEEYEVQIAAIRAEYDKERRRADGKDHALKLLEADTIEKEHRHTAEVAALQDELETLRHRPRPPAGRVEAVVFPTEELEGLLGDWTEQCAKANEDRQAGLEALHSATSGAAGQLAELDAVIDGVRTAAQTFRDAATAAKDGDRALLDALSQQVDESYQSLCGIQSVNDRLIEVAKTGEAEYRRLVATLKDTAAQPIANVTEEVLARLDAVWGQLNQAILERQNSLAAATNIVKEAADQVHDTEAVLHDAALQVKSTATEGAGGVARARQTLEAATMAVETEMEATVAAAVADSARRADRAEATVRLMTKELETTKKEMSGLNEALERSRAGREADAARAEHAAELAAREIGVLEEKVVQAREAAAEHKAELLQATAALTRTEQAASDARFSMEAALEHARVGAAADADKLARLTKERDEATDRLDAALNGTGADSVGLSPYALLEARYRAVVETNEAMITATETQADFGARFEEVVTAGQARIDALVDRMIHYAESIEHTETESWAQLEAQQAGVRTQLAAVGANLMEAAAAHVTQASALADRVEEGADQRWGLQRHLAELGDTAARHGEVIEVISDRMSTLGASLDAADPDKLVVEAERLHDMVLADLQARERRAEAVEEGLAAAYDSSEAVGHVVDEINGLKDALEAMRELAGSQAAKYEDGLKRLQTGIKERDRALSQRAQLYADQKRKLLAAHDAEIEKLVHGHEEELKKLKTRLARADKTWKGREASLLSQVQELSAGRERELLALKAQSGAEQQRRTATEAALEKMAAASARQQDVLENERIVFEATIAELRDLMAAQDEAAGEVQREQAVITDNLKRDMAGLTAKMQETLDNMATEHGRVLDGLRQATDNVMLQRDGERRDFEGVRKALEKQLKDVSTDRDDLTRRLQEYWQQSGAKERWVNDQFDALKRDFGQMVERRERQGSPLSDVSHRSPRDVGGSRRGWRNGE